MPRFVIVFRLVIVFCLSAGCCFLMGTLTPSAKAADPPSRPVPESRSEDGYIPLFNGRDLQGWTVRRADRRGYVVEKGLLVCPADGGGFLFTDKENGDFSLRFEFRLTPGANNGVAIRCPLLDERPAYDGIEIQILDDIGYPRPLRPAQYHGSIYDVVAAKRGAVKPAGQWNCEEVVCCGSRVTVIVNGTVVVDVDLEQITDPRVLKRHPGLKRRRGHIGFLGHGSRVEFRNIRIKPLDCS